MKGPVKHQTRFSLLAAVLVLAVAISACGAAAPTATATTAPKVAAPTATTAPAAAPTATKAASAASAPTNTPPPQPTATTPPTTKPAAAAPTATQATASGGNTPDVLANAQRAMMGAKSLRMTITTTAADGTTNNTVIEYVAPDRLHMTTAGSESIIIKDVGMYRKDPQSGQWQLLPGTAPVAASSFSFLDPKQIDDLMKSIVVDKFRQVGTDTIGGKPMRVYEYTTVIDTGGTTPTTSTSKIWIGVADGLPYRSEGSSDVTGTTSTTVVVYEYPANLKIEPPA